MSPARDTACPGNGTRLSSARPEVGRRRANPDFLVGPGVAQYLRRSEIPPPRPFDFFARHRSGARGSLRQFAGGAAVVFRKEGDRRFVETAGGAGLRSNQARPCWQLDESL